MVRNVPHIGEPPRTGKTHDPVNVGDAAYTGEPPRTGKTRERSYAHALLGKVNPRVRGNISRCPRIGPAPVTPAYGEDTLAIAPITRAISESKVVNDVEPAQAPMAQGRRQSYCARRRRGRFHVVPRDRGESSRRLFIYALSSPRRV